jgi:diamine N-acetyltransferase
LELCIRPCSTSDLETLRQIGMTTFDETFREMNTPETMNLYLQEAFAHSKLLGELQNPFSQFFFLYVDGILAGYVKLNDATAQSDLKDPEALEIERIYVCSNQKRKGLGSYLMQFALQKATEMGKNYAWLGVWEKNPAAISFYRKMGFKEAGRHVFRMGEELQTDLIMRKDLEPSCE